VWVSAFGVEDRKAAIGAEGAGSVRCCGTHDGESDANLRGVKDVQQDSIAGMTTSNPYEEGARSLL
jgi:hypothetical protein